MTNHQAYDLAISLGQIQAAIVFKKRMKAEVAELESICSSMLTATRADYANLDDLCSVAHFQGLDELCESLSAHIEIDELGLTEWVNPLR